MNAPYGPGRPPQKSAKTAVTVALLLACMACATGYYAFELWQSKKTTETQLKSAKVEVTRLKQETHATGEQVRVLEKNQATRNLELSEARTHVRDLSARLAASESKLGELSEERAEIKKRLAEFRRFTQAFQRMIDSGRLEVSFRRGRMIVELPAKVLFPSGSADLTDEGKSSLADVAKVLRKIRGKHFIVGGHTDNVPVATKEFPSNWELSAARAVRVTRALVRAGMPPRRLVAAGYGPHDPIATNKSRRGRHRNRRIEIILEPRLRNVPGLD